MEIKKIKFEIHGDDRGKLVSLEVGNNIPFDVKRVYYIYDTSSGISRGFHAHRELKQLVIAIKGSCILKLDNGHERTQVLLNNPSEACLLDSRIWREMHDFSEDCVLLVLANNEYKESDYIRDYEQFILEANCDT